MNLAVQRVAVWGGFSLPAGFALSLAWSWSDWALGLCTEFASGGLAAFALGPLQVMAEWSILS